MVRKLTAMILAALMCVSLVPAAYAAEGKYTGKLNILHVNDVHGYAVETDAAIGFAKIAGYAAKLRQENPNTLLLDAGDVFQGNVYATFDKAESLINVLNTVGFDAMVGGNSDFMLGAEKLTQITNALKYPVLGANMKMTATGANIGNVQDYTVVEMDGGVKVGIIGVTTPDSTAQNTDTYTYIDAVAKTKELASELKPQVDILVALCHVGVDDESTLEVTAYDIANAVPELDVIIDGHSHTVFKEGKVVNGVLIASTGSYSTNLGLVELDIKDGKLTGAAAKLVAKEDFADAAEDQETKAAVEKLLAAYDKTMSQVVGSSLIFLDAARETIRTGETNMGNLFTDAMRAWTDADIAVAVAGGIGGNTDPGDITKGNILSMARIESLVVTVKMTGEHIMTVLNRSMSAYPEMSGSFLQVSGISFKFDPSLDAASRVFDVTVDGAPLSLTDTYVVACFEGMQGGDPGFKDGELLKKWANTDEILEWYFSENSPVNPEVEGRIVAAEKPGKPESKVNFADLDPNAPYYKQVCELVDAGVFNGTGPSTFSPDGVLTRGMLVTLLGRLAENAGLETAGFTSDFTDVKPDDWYAGYVAWAVSNGVANGYGNGVFGVADAVTGEQFVSMLTQFAGYAKTDVAINALTSQTVTRADAAAALAALLVK